MGFGGLVEVDVVRVHVYGTLVVVELVVDIVALHQLYLYDHGIIPISGIFRNPLKTEALSL